MLPVLLLAMFLAGASSVQAGGASGTPGSTSGTPGGATSGGGTRTDGTRRLTDVLGTPAAGRATGGGAALESGLISVVSGATPITLVALSVSAVEEGVRLAWEISDDSDPVGFSVWRAAAANGPWERLTERLLPATVREYVDGAAPATGTLWYRLSGIDRVGTEVHFGAVSFTREAPPPPAALRLHQNYPNPMNPATLFALDLPEAGAVRLDVFDVRGRLVAVVYDGPLEAGRHLIPWAGRGVEGPLPGGVYLYRLTALGRTETRKLVIGR